MANTAIVDPFAQVNAAATQPSIVDPFDPTYEKPKSSFLRGVNAAARGYSEGLLSTAALGLNAVGATDTGARALAAAKGEEEKGAGDTMRVEDVNDLQSGGEFLKYAGGYLGTQLLGNFATGILGRFLGGNAGELARGAAGRLVGQQAGTMAGLAGNSLMQEIGQIYPDAVDNAVNDPIKRTLIGASTAAALDFAPEYLLAKRLGLVGGHMLPREGSRVAAGLKDAAKFGAGEGATELAQTYIERQSSGQSITGPEANSDYLNSAVLGILGGGVLGGTSGALRPRVPVQNPTPFTESEQAPATEQTPPETAVPPAAAPEPTPFEAFPSGSAALDIRADEMRLADTTPNVTEPDLNGSPASEFLSKTRSPEATVLGGQSAGGPTPPLVNPIDTPGFARTADQLIDLATRGRAAPPLEIAGGSYSTRAKAASIDPASAREIILDSVNSLAKDRVKELVTSGLLKSEKTATSVQSGIMRAASAMFSEPDAATARSNFTGAIAGILKGKLKAVDAATFADNFVAALGQNTKLRSVAAVETVASDPRVLASKAALAIDRPENAPRPPVGALTANVGRIFATHLDSGGSTTNLLDGRSLAGTPNFSVSIYKDRELRVPGQPLEGAIKGYIEKNADLLSVPGNTLGTWYNEADGHTYIDVSIVTPSQQDALKYARENRQLAIFDLRTFTEIPVSHPIFDSAQTYNYRNGVVPIVDTPYTDVAPATQSQIAAAYEAAPVVDEAARPSYGALAAETAQQYAELSRAIKIEPWTRTGQPYASSSEMRADVFGNGHLWVFDGGEPHPVLTPQQNFQFRAVHDAYGHARTGFEFGPRGELNATRAHAQMYSNVALPALVTETIGQNSWVNFGEQNAGKAPADRAFAVQKAALMPEALWRPLLRTALDERMEAQLRADQAATERGQEVVKRLTAILGSPAGLEIHTSATLGDTGAINFGALKDIIEVNLNAKDALSVGNHEGYHYLEFKVLSDTERAVVKRAFAQGSPMFKAVLEKVAAYDAKNATKIADEVLAKPVEARAYAFEFWARGELKASGLVARAFAAIRRVVERIQNMIAGLGFQSHEDIFRAIDAGRYAQLAERGEGAPFRSIATDSAYLGDIEADAIPGAQTYRRDAAASGARGRPFWVQSPNDVRGMRTRVRLLALEGVAARDWHARSASAIMEWAGGDRHRAAKLAALIANYSPRTPVGRDLTKALTHLAQWENSQPVRVGAPESHIRTASDLLAGRANLDENGYFEPTGIKRQNFFRNLMLGIDPVRYNTETQGATIDMWMSHAFNYGEPSGAITKSQYNYADAEVKRLARELGWGVEETQAAVWVAIKARGDTTRSLMEKTAAKNGWYEFRAKKPDALAQRDLLGEPIGQKYDRTVKPEFARAFTTQWMNFALQTKYSQEAFDRANYSYKEAFDDVKAGRLAVEPSILPYDVSTDATQDHESLERPLSLFSRAALSDLAVRARLGEIPQSQVNAQVATMLDSPDIRASGLRDQFLSNAKNELSGFAGSFKRGYFSQVSSGENLSRHSAGYKNFFSALTSYIQRKNRLIADAVDSRLSSWVKGATETDKKTVAAALLERTVNNYTTDSREYAAIRGKLNEKQVEMFDQATAMVAHMLDAEYVADRKAYGAILGEQSPEYSEWASSRGAQVEDLKKRGYFPERRYGDHVVHAYVEGPEGKRLTVFYSQYQSEAAARGELDQIKRAFSVDPNVRTEYGYRYKAEYDGSLSLAQFLDMARRYDVGITQNEKERLAKALISADSIRRNRIFQRQNIAGYSEDGMRILAEFGVGMANKIAYHELGPTVQDALAGKAVTTVFNPDGTVTTSVDRTSNVWARDGELSGFYHNLADKTADYVMSPSGETSTLSRGLRGMASVQFLGGSMSAGVVQLSSIPMNTVPWLTQRTGYFDAFSRALGALRTSIANYSTLTDIPTLLNESIAIPAVDAVPGLRRALQIAAQDGTILDTEIYQIMGLSRGQEYSFSGRTRAAMTAWMSPFRVTERLNRLTTFLSSYQLAKEQNATDDAAYKSAQEAVYGTQFRYDQANRPALARGDVGSLLFTFKSYPIFMLETIAHLYRTDPKAAVFMTLSLAAMAGVEGLPFAEDIEDLVDTIGQRVFNSPFNSKRAMRNMLKSASEAVVGADLSSVFMHGLANEFTGMNFATRVGLGNLIPGSRIGAADADYKHVVSDILGPVGNMVGGYLGGADQLLKGQFTEAARTALPLAAQNLIKGWQDWQHGYATDIGSRKIVDMNGWESFWQGMGFTSTALGKAYDTDRIDKQTSAFYKSIHQLATGDLMKAILAGDKEGAQRTMDGVLAWNKAHPDMPLALSPAGVRREIQLGGLPLNQRTYLTLPHILRGGSEYAVGIQH